MTKPTTPETELLRFPGAPSTRRASQTDLQPWTTEIDSRKDQTRRRIPRFGLNTIIVGSGAATMLVCQTPAPAEDFISVNKGHILDGSIVTHSHTMAEPELDLGVAPSALERLANSPIASDILAGVEVESIPSYADLFHFAVELEVEDHEE